MASGRVPKTLMIRSFSTSVLLLLRRGTGGRVLLGMVVGIAGDPGYGVGRARQGGDGEDHLHVAGGDDHHRAQAQDDGHQVQGGDRLLLVHAHVDELVVGMAAVRLHGVLPLEDAAGEGGGGVKDGEAQDDEGHHEGDDGVELEQPRHRYRSQDEAQEGGAGVPHEDLGGVAVVGDESDAPAHQGRADHRHLHVAHEQGDDEHGHGRDGADAVRQAVQAVDQVHGVGHRHDPDDGDGHGHDAKVPVFPAQEGEGVGDHLDDHPVPDGDQGRHDLQDKLDARAQGVGVVHHAYGHDDASPQQDAPQLPVHIGEGQHRHHKADEDRQTAQPGDGMVMHPAFVLGDVHRADLYRQQLHQRRQGEAQAQGYRQGEDHRQDARPIKNTVHVAVRPLLTWPRSRSSCRPCAGSFPPCRRPSPRPRGRRSPGRPCPPGCGGSPPGWGGSSPPRPRPRRA